jgi:hypothetical protein
METIKMRQKQIVQPMEFLLIAQQVLTRNLQSLAPL